MDLKLRGRIVETYRNGIVVMAFAKADIPYAIPKAADLKERKCDASIIFNEWVDERSIPQNNLYHLVKDRIAQKSGNDIDAVDQFLKEEFGEKKSVRVKRIRYFYKEIETGNLLGQKEWLKLMASIKDDDVKRQVDFQYEKIRDEYEEDRIILVSTTQLNKLQMMRLIEGAIYKASEYGADVIAEKKEHERIKEEIFGGKKEGDK